MTITRARWDTGSARGAAWLARWKAGETIRGIAAGDRCSVSAVERGIAAALAALPPPGPLKRDEAGRVLFPQLVPSFGAGCKPKPTCKDIHPRGDIPRGSVLCCMSCHRSGVDDLPALQLGPDDVLPAEPLPKRGRLAA